MIQAVVAGKVIVVGSMNMDLSVTVNEIPAPGETVLGTHLQRLPGGKGGNQAVAAARLGASVTLLGMIGADSFGEELISSAVDAGIDVSVIQVHTSKPTGTALISVSQSGENSIIVVPGSNSELSPQITEKALSRIGRFEVLAASLEVPVETIEVSLNYARMIGAKSVLNLSPVVESGIKLISLADFTVINEHEALEISGFGVENLDQVFIKFKHLGARELIITRGAAGAIYINLLNESVVLKSLRAPIVKAIDTTGCGDAFLGAFASEIARKANVDEALNLAIKAGSYAALGMGAQPSYGNLASIKSL